MTTWWTGRKRGPMSAEHRAKLSAANTGKKASPETRAKMSATRTGKRYPARKKPSPETLAKRSASLTGKRYPGVGRKRGLAARIAEPGYGAIHARLKVDRGPPRAFACTHCERPARHWALDHENPTENFRTQVGGSYDGLDYSLNVNDYIPLCPSCHTAFDLKEASQ